MGTPFGDYLRGCRDATPPGSVGVAVGPRRRVPGLRRAELAELAGLSVEYLTRLEQGQDRNPSVAVVNALADALHLDTARRWRFTQLAKLTSTTCVGPPVSSSRDIRPTVRAVLEQLEPGLAFVTTRAGDIVASTTGFELIARPTGLLDTDPPNLTRFVFTDARAPRAFPDWEHVADDRASELQLAAGPDAEALVTELAAAAGPAFASRLCRHDAPERRPERWRVPSVGELRFEREVLELPVVDAQQLVVLVPADTTTTAALERARHETAPVLLAIGERSAS